MFLRILFLVMISAWIVGAIASIVAGKGVIARGGAALGAGVGSAACLLLGVTALVTGQSLTLGSARMLPVGGLMLRLDGLGAFFLVIVGLIGLASHVYGYAYAANSEPPYSLPPPGPMPDP